MLEPETERTAAATCPLCATSGAGATVSGADRRRYHHCATCWLVFADPCHRLSPDDEKHRYATHRNGIDNEGYVQLLSRVLHPVLPWLGPGARGLDYGCGPGPTLSLLARRHGIACDDYDPIFAPSPPAPPYDVIFCTECFEHFHRPDEDVQRILGLLKPGGLLGVMTEQWTTIEQLKSWHYTRDPTHVSFFHARTFEYISGRYGLTPLWQDENRVRIFRRKWCPSIIG